jgi:hypothetical protein
LGSVRYWVHKRFHKDVAAADADLAATGSSGTGYPPPPGYGPPGTSVG